MPCWPFVSLLKMWRSKRIGGRRSARNPQPEVSTESTLQISGAWMDRLSATALRPSVLRASDFPTKSMIEVSLSRLQPADRRRKAIVCPTVYEGGGGSYPLESFIV